MATREHPFRRLGAAVDYSSLRTLFQRIRIVGAGLLALVAIFAQTSGAPHAWIPAAAASVSLLHALLRGRRAGSITESLVIDAAVIAFAVGLDDRLHVVLVAAAAYLITASVTFAGVRSLLASIGTLVTALLARQLFDIPEAGPAASEAGPEIWGAVLIFLAGMMLSLSAAAAAVAAARRRQEDAVAAERRASDMKNEFVSMVTHELRTPLTNIAGFAMTLSDTWRDLDPAEAEEFLQIIVTESEHLSKLVDDVLAIPRLEAGRLLVDITAFPLQPAAYRIADLLFPAGGERSATVSIGGSVWVNADPNRVEQVLRNLLENARKYGGDRVSVEAERREDQWLVVVADDGPGVPIEYRERIFGRFEQVPSGHTRLASGFGLGLSVVKHLVEAMGGEVWYEPGFPIGARFCFTLPAADERAAAEVN